MTYQSSLIKKEREQIFRLFLENTKLKFNEIKNALKINSNKVAYHMKRMQKDKILEKENNSYYLTKNAEKYLPILSNIISQNLSPLPIVLVAIVNKNRILLLKRYRRPYRNYWGLIGGKMLLEESIKDTTFRLISEKTSIKSIKFISTNSILHERVKDNSIIKHSFILLFTKASTNNYEFTENKYGKLKWFNIKGIEKYKVIPSDLYLIKNKLNSRIDIKSGSMNEYKGRLSKLILSKN